MVKYLSLFLNGLLVFLLVFTIHPQVAFADDGTPASDESITVEETSPPEEEVEEAGEDLEPGQNEVEEEPIPDAPLPLVEDISEATSEDTPEVIPEPVSTSEPETPQVVEVDEEAEELTPSEVLEQAPEGTKIVVLDSEGQAEPLASQEAAEIVTTGDPMWCPSTALPGDATCSSSYSSFEDLLVDLGSFSGDGTIYVANTYNSALESDDITIDGSVYTSLGALTIQGGWDGVLGAANIVGTSSFDGVSLEIINWVGPVTVQDIRVINTLYGLEIGTSGAVTLDNVQVTGTTSNNGIGIQAGGEVSLNDVVSSSNLENGADIHTTSGNVDISNSTFNNNGGLDPLTNTAYGTGVSAESQSNGNITVSNVTAAGNVEGGAAFNAQGSVTLEDSTFDNNTFFTNTASGDVYGGFGLDVTAGTSIDMNHVSGSGNYLFGADLTAGTTLSISDSDFDGNDAFSTHSIADGFGLDAVAGGDINLTNVSASNNYLFGADIVSTAGILNLQTGIFSSNLTDSGLLATSTGLLTMNNISASNNGNTGAVLESSSDIIVSDSTFNNNSGASYAAGIEVVSPGVVTFSNVTANSNQDDGIAISGSPEVHLDNVTVDHNGWDGAYVDGLCTKIYLSNGNYTNNGFVHPLGGYGLEVDNGVIYQNGRPVFANNFLGAIRQKLDPCFKIPLTDKVEEPRKTGYALPVNSGQLVSLTCDEAVITLITPEDTHATFKGLCNFQVFVFDESTSDLNNRLPVLGLPYYNGVTITLLFENSEVSTLPATSSIVLSFRVSDEEIEQEFAVYHWDGANWIELEGVKKVAGRVEITTQNVGTFVLVTR